MRNEMAQEFKQMLEWDGSEQKQLQEQMALFQYLFAHAMPELRGSAAISEWLRWQSIVSWVFGGLQPREKC